MRPFNYYCKVTSNNTFYLLGNQLFLIKKYTTVSIPAKVKNPVFMIT